MRLADLTTDVIEQRLVAAERLIAQARAVQLAGLAELDRRQVPIGDGCRSLAEWTASRLDVSPETAQILATAARRLQDQPRLTSALSAGEVPFERAYELTRVPDVGEADIAGSWHLDIASLRRHAALRRRLTRRDERHRENYLRIQPSLDYASGRLWGEMPGYACRVVEKALDERADAFPVGPDGQEPLATRRAQALFAIAEDELAGGSGGEGSPTISVFVDAETAAQTHGEAGVRTDTGLRVGPNTLEALICTGRVEVNVIGARSLALGRASRAVPARLRRVVLHRDGGCSADGCTSTYRLQPHHVIPWSQGGTTDPDNLTTLCWFHHHVVIHQRGYRIDPQSPPLRRRFLGPAGRNPPDT